MSHSYVSQFIHVIWSTDNQKYLLSPPIKNELYAYISALVKAKNGQVFACGGSADHIHLLVLLSSEVSISNLLSHIKSYSSKWIKNRNSIDPQFAWQTGYLAFSVQKDRVNNVCDYIKSDEARHQTLKRSYPDEVIAMLQQQGIQPHPQYFLQNSHSKIYVHAVWSTYNRHPYLNKDIRGDLYAQMKDVVSNCRGYVHEVGGIEDHIHLLMETPKDMTLSDLMKEIKTHATHWLKRADSTKYRDFEWQVGYGAFSISLSSVEDVKNYIKNQESHHQRRTYKEETEEFLLKHGVLQSS